MKNPMAEVVSLLREIVRILRASPEGRISYSVPEFAALVGLSEDQVRRHIELGDINPRHSGTKKLIPIEEARAFMERLPEEDMGALR